MKLNRIIYFSIALFLLHNCSSVKLVDSSFTKDDHTLKSKKILVIARSEDLGVRKAYEDELADEIKKKGFNAVTAYQLFPDLKEKRNRSEEEIHDVVKRFKEKGIESIVLTSLRNTKTIRPESHNDKDYATSNIKKGKYGVSFADYYNVNSIEFLSSSLRPSTVNLETETYESYLESTIYSLEAVVYDLTLTQENQLVGVYEIDATDPKSAKQVLQKFTSIVAKQLK